MRNSTIWDKGRKNAARAGVLLFWLLVWEIIYRIVGREVLLVSPVRALARLLELGREVYFWRTVFATCSRVLAGFGLAAVIGTVLAAFSSGVRWLKALLEPLLGVVRSTPVASFIILALVWIRDTGRLPVFIAFLMVAPMFWANVYAGIEGTDRELLEMAKLFRMSPFRRLRYIYVPQVTPHFIAACTTGIGAAWKSAIAAEVIALPLLAMGKQIYNAKIYLETLDLFAWTIAVVLLSVLLEKTALAGLRRLQERLLTVRLN